MTALSLESIALTVFLVELDLFVVLLNNAVKRRVLITALSQTRVRIR